jgi:hypothetical protein
MAEDIKEPYTWKCRFCKVKGKAATRADARLMQELHEGMVHGGDKRKKK